jgi:putative transposase
MRYPVPEKVEIICLVEQSNLPIEQTLDKLGVPRTTFYRWYDRYQIGGRRLGRPIAPSVPGLESYSR